MMLKSYIVVAMILNFLKHQLQSKKCRSIIIILLDKYCMDIEHV